MVSAGCRGAAGSLFERDLLCRWVGDNSCCCVPIPHIQGPNGESQYSYLCLLCRFITGIPLKPEDTKPSRIPKVYINTEGVLQDYHLLVYRALSVTVCALIKGNRYH